jgi:hypothetical protein
MKKNLQVSFTKKFRNILRGARGINLFYETKNLEL